MAVNDGVVVVLVDDDSCKVFIFTADALCDIVLTVVDPGDIIVLTADVPGDFIVLIAGADSCVGGSGDEQGIGEAPIDTFNLKFVIYVIFNHNEIIIEIFFLSEFLIINIVRKQAPK
jgi:hypothetical protein